MSKVVTRFAPSPTGKLHIGGARTALFNWLFARAQGGKFILRIEDTDKERSSVEYEKDIFDSLKWMGIDWDETFKQSDKIAQHQDAIKALIDKGFAYECEEDRKEGSGKIKLVRFKNKKEDVVFNDLVRGEIKSETESIGDFIIAKETDRVMMPLYHLAVVVDDNYSNVTHIIRGEDHITNTARQILIQKALGYETPEYAHMSLTMSPSGGKLSKRSGVDISISSFMNSYLNTAFLNFLALLGWHPLNDREVLTVDELMKEFSIERFQKSGAVFDIKKLHWLQSEHIKKLSADEFHNLIYAVAKEKNFSDEQIEKMKEELQQRIVRLDEIGKLLDEDWSFVNNVPEVTIGEVVWKDTSEEETRNHLKMVIGLLEAVDGSEWSKNSVKEAIWGYSSDAEGGRGAVLWPVRYALTGKQSSPNPFVVADIIGKEETIRRLSI